MKKKKGVIFWYNISVGILFVLSAIISSLIGSTFRKVFYTISITIIVLFILLTVIVIIKDAKKGNEDTSPGITIAILLIALMIIFGTSFFCSQVVGVDIPAAFQLLVFGSVLCNLIRDFISKFRSVTPISTPDQNQKSNKPENNSKN